MLEKAGPELEIASGLLFKIHVIKIRVLWNSENPEILKGSDYHGGIRGANPLTPMTCIALERQSDCLRTVNSASLHISSHCAI